MFDARKIWVIASTEYGSAVRTKSFLIGIFLVPVIMGISILLQVFVAKRVDTQPRRFAVLDRTDVLYGPIEKAAESRNASLMGKEGKLIGPRFDPQRVAADLSGENATLFDLSERVRRHEIDAFVVIPTKIFEVPAPGSQSELIGYYSDNPNDSVLRDWLMGTINDLVRNQRFVTTGIDQKLAERVNQNVGIDNLGLVSRAEGPAAGEGAQIQAAERVDPIRTNVVPAILLFIVFFAIMSSGPQLLNTVIEEKMSRISEVLLGSVTPFELMLGKLLGNVGLALTLVAFYVAGGFAVAIYYDFAKVIPVSLLAALTFYVVVGVVLYGSLYMAIGSACNDLKDAQSLMMPVVLLAMLPMLVWTIVLKNPASPLSVGLSLFPPATPFLMLMRLALHPAPPLWQIALSFILTTATALACVWAAAKIFRTGLLMQGKAPSLRELARWVIAR